MTMPFERVVWIVLDSVGIGAMPDAGAYGDAGSDTLGNVARKRKLELPNLAVSVSPISSCLAGLPRAEHPAGAYGKCRLASPGKDTTTGHWEMAGIILEQAISSLPARLSARCDRRIREKNRPQDPRQQSPLPAPRSSRNSARSTCEPARRSSIHPPTASSRLPRTRRIIPVPELYRICEIAREISARTQ